MADVKQKEGEQAADPRPGGSVNAEKACHLEKHGTTTYVQRLAARIAQTTSGDTNKLMTPHVENIQITFV